MKIPSLPRRLDPRTLAGATLAALAPGLALAGPHGESVVAGIASIGRPDALTTLVQQTSNSAVINWQQFNVGADEFVVFQQPSSSSVVLNRVIGNDASQIFGSIAANGRVFLSNPNGVLFAPGARLDVNGLVATTFGISDEDFMAGRYAFARAAGAPDAGVVNQGAVQTAAGGFVVLAGDFARNEGVIAAPAGSVLLAAGARTTLNLDGMGLVDFAVDEPTLSAAAGVSNAGQILAEGGMVVMTARVANQLVSTVVNNSGLVRASRIADQGGELWLVGEGGAVANSGVLDASGEDGDGGRVVMYGDQDVTHSGTVLADGAGAGGEVRAIAGGTLTVAEGSVISARGGPDSESAGGMVEVSGYGSLHLRGTIEVGDGGMVVIDPSTLTLYPGSSSPGSVGSVYVGFISNQLNSGADIKLIASTSIGESTPGLLITSSNPAGDLLIEIGSSAPLCTMGIGEGICTTPFGTFTPAAGGSINLSGLTINIAGALFVDALQGSIAFGNVTASAITVNDAGNRFDSFNAASLSATSGNISLFGRGSVNIANGVGANIGDVHVDLGGGSGSANVNFGSGVSAGNDVFVQVQAPSNATIQVASGVNAGNAVTLNTTAISGRAAVTVGSGSAASGVTAVGTVQIQAFDLSSGSTLTGIHIGNGGPSDNVIGSAININANSTGPGGSVRIDGSVTATSGNITIAAAGVGSSFASPSGDAGNLTVGGAVTATGDITLSATDTNGSGGGEIRVGSVSGLNVNLNAIGWTSAGTGSASGGGKIVIGVGSFSLITGGALTATGNAVLNADAGSNNYGGGTIIVGTTNVTGNLTVTATGGSSGGVVLFGSSASSGGAVYSPASVTVGGNLVASVDGDAGRFHAGAISANAIDIDVLNSVTSGRQVRITTGDLTANGTGPSDGVFLHAFNSAGTDSAIVTVGSVAGARIDVNTALQRFDTFSATSLSASVGEIRLFGRSDINITGATIATGGGLLAELFGGSGDMNVALGAITTATNAALTANTSSGFAGVQVNGPISTGGGFTANAQTAAGAADVYLSDAGGVVAGGAVQISAVATGGASPGTQVSTLGPITGTNVQVAASSNYTGGNLDIGGAVAATSGNVDLSAQGAGAGGPSGMMSVAGAVTATGTVNLLAQDVNGNGGGTISVHTIAGSSIAVSAQGAGIGSATNGGGQIVIGTGSISGAILGGPLDATGNATLSADGDNNNGGVIVVGDVTVGGDLTLSVTGGPNGGSILVADFITSTGSIAAPGTMAVGGVLSANLVGDSGRFVSGDITADRIGINLQRTLATPRGVSVTTGNLIGTGVGPSDLVYVGAENHNALGAATVTVGNVNAPGMPVSLVAQTQFGGGSPAAILAGDITGAAVQANNYMGNGHIGTVDLGAVTGTSLLVQSASNVNTSNLSVTSNLQVVSQIGNITTGDLAANNAGNPVTINVQTGGTGASISVGAIAASGQRAPSGGYDHGATVAVDAGLSGGDLTVAGPVSVTGIGRAFSGSGSDSYATFNYSGFAGGAELQLLAGMSGTLTVNHPGGITLTGAGFAEAMLNGASVVVAGPIAATATPVSVTTNGTLHPTGVCSQTCAVTYTEIMTNGGDAYVQIGGAGYPTGLVDLGTVTATGPQAGIMLSGQTIQTADLSANGGAHHYQRSSSGTIGGQPHAFSDDFQGGGGEIKLNTGTGTTSITVTGNVTASAPGFAGVLLAADTVAAGNVSATTTGGLFVRSGSPANPAFGDEGPFDQENGALPALTTGTMTGGIALIDIGDQGSCSACSLGPATTVNVGGLNASAPGTAVISVNAASTSVTGAVGALATAGSRVGVSQYQYSDASSIVYAATENVNFAGGEARIFVDGDGALTVGGAMSAVGAFASIDLGITSGTLQAVTLTQSGGSGIMTGTYDAAGTANDYSASFQGPGTMQGFVAGPDSGGVGTIVINGPIDVDAVGFGAVIVRAGSVTTGAIDLNVTPGTFQYYDSRTDAVPVIVTTGDAIFAVHDHASVGVYGRAAVNGPVNVGASGGLFVRSQFDNLANPTTLNAGGFVSETFSAHLARLNQITCDGGSCSLGSYAPVDLALYTGAIAGNTAIDLPTASVSFGAGEQANGGDPFVVSTFGLGHANPNGVIKTLGALDIGLVGLTGDYLLIEQGISNAVPISSASLGAGAVVQFVRGGGSPLSLEQSGTGSGIFSVVNDVGAFTGAGAELVFGHTVSGGGIAVGTVTAPNLTGENVTLIGPSGITGVNPISALTLATASGSAQTTLVTQTATLEVLNAGLVSIDNTGFTGAATATLPAGTTSVNLLSGGALAVTGPFTGTSFTANAAGDLTLTGAIASSGNLNVVTGGLFAATGVLTAGNLVLDGVAGVTDFLATTNAGTISIDGANAVMLDNSARTGAAIVNIVGVSPTSLDLMTGGSLQLAGGFNGTYLALSGTALDLGATAHTATATMALATASTLNAPALLTAGSLTVDAAPTTAVALTTASASIQVDEAATLSVNDSAFTGGAVVFLPLGTTTADLSFGGNGQVNGAFSGASFAANAVGDLTLTGAVTASGNVSLVTGGFFGATGAVTAGSLVLDGVAGVTDFFATTNTGAIAIDGADAVALDNSARTGATSVTLLGSSPTSLDVLTGGALTLAGVAFNGTTLTLAGTNLDLGTGAHSASGTMSLTTAGALLAPSLLTATAIVIDAAPTSAIALNTSTASLSIDEGASLALTDATVGGVTMALPTGITSATLSFAGSATLTGSFSGTALSISSPGDLNLSGASYTASGAISLTTGGFFSTTGTLTAAGLLLDGVAGVSDFSAVTHSGAITIDGANSVALDNSAQTGATTVTLAGASPTSLDVLTGGDLALAGTAFSGTNLVLDGASLALGAASHSATGVMQLTSAGTINATGVLTAGSFSATTATAVPLAFTTNTGSISIVVPGGSTLSINNNAFTGATSFALPSGLLVANLAFGGDATIVGAFNGSSLNFASAGALTMAGGGYTTTGAMFINSGTGVSVSGPLTVGGQLTLIDASGAANATLTTDAGAITLDGWGAVSLDNTARTGATTVDFGILMPDSVAIASGGTLTLAEAFNGTALSLEGTSLDLGAANHSATSGISLITASTLNATGTLAGGSLSIDGVASTTVAIATTTADLYIVEAGTVTVDAAPAAGTLSLGFGSTPFGAVDVGCIGDVLLNTGITATSFALAASGNIDDGGGVPALARTSRDGSAPAAIQPRALAGTITADVVFIEANGYLQLGNTTFVIGAGDGITGVTDATLLGALINEGIGPVAQVVSNGTFLAGSALSLGQVTSAGSYLVLQGDSLALTGAISGPADLLVQIAPATSTNTFSIESSIAGTAQTNYTFSATLGQITAQTLVIGASTSSGAVTVGANGAFDVAPLNFIVASGGTVTDIGNVTSTGIVNTLAGLIAGPVVEPPILVEIDPNVANPPPPVETSAGVATAPSDTADEGGDGSGEDDEEDDEGEDTSTETAESEEEAGLVTQQSAVPAGVCGK